MSHTLVTFLGKSRENKDTGYRETVYRFPDRAEDRTLRDPLIFCMK